VAAVKNDSTVILDTSGIYLREGIKAGPHILKLNIQELESAFNIKLGTDGRLSKFIKKLAKKYGIKAVIVTLNGKGSVMYNHAGFHFFKTIKVKKILSPVGSGDAYSAGLAYGIEKDLNLVDSCMIGAAAAAANLSHEGSCFIEKKEVLKLLPPGLLI
jgi:fructose-1-phosphate kinase PfkB-like protein